MLLNSSRVKEENKSEKDKKQHSLDFFKMLSSTVFDGDIDGDNYKYQKGNILLGLIKCGHICTQNLFWS